MFWGTNPSGSIAVRRYSFASRRAREANGTNRFLCSLGWVRRSRRLKSALCSRIYLRSTLWCSTGEGSIGAFGGGRKLVYIFMSAMVQDRIETVSRECRDHVEVGIVQEGSLYTPLDLGRWIPIRFQRCVSVAMHGAGYRAFRLRGDLMPLNTAAHIDGLSACFAIFSGCTH